VPVPMMPFIEFFGLFTPPFALMLRLFSRRPNQEHPHSPKRHGEVLVLK